MNPAPTSIPSRRGRIRVLLFLCLMVPTVTILAVGMLVLSCLRLQGAAADLRRGLVDELPGRWEKRIEVHAGRFTTWLARRVAGRIDLPDEARQAARALRQADVGVYQAVSRSAGSRWAMLGHGDRTMTRRGWERVVTVVERDHLVAVYAPRELERASRARFALVVADASQLVLASGVGDLEPIGELARARLARR